MHLVEGKMLTETEQKGKYFFLFNRFFRSESSQIFLIKFTISRCFKIAYVGDIYLDFCDLSGRHNVAECAQLVYT